VESTGVHVDCVEDGKVLGLCGDRVFKSTVDEDYSSEMFVGYEETNMASPTVRDKGYEQRRC